MPGGVLCPFIPVLMHAAFLLEEERELLTGLWGNNPAHSKVLSVQALSGKARTYNGSVWKSPYQVRDNGNGKGKVEGMLSNDDSA